VNEREAAGPPPADCPFCQIVAGAESAQVVYATAETLAFFPLHPASVGHTLIVPRQHVRDLWELDQKLVGPLFSAVLVVSRALRNVLKPEGLNVIASSGAAASQTIFHLHVHVVPRWDHDRIGPIWPPADPWTDQVTAGLADQVRQACADIA
jgi:histidine triad (HIT) family protein